MSKKEKPKNPRVPKSPVNPRGKNRQSDAPTEAQLNDNSQDMGGTLGTGTAMESDGRGSKN